MFGQLSLQSAQQLIPRTWNCVAHYASLIWLKLHWNNSREGFAIMPRSRRRHHSRSRSKSRSRSHSHDRDRDTKRRKIESFDSPHHRRSVSSERDEPKATEHTDTPRIVDTSSCELVKSSADTSGEVGNDSSEVAKSSCAVVKASCDVGVKRVEVTPTRTFSPRQLQRRAESEKKRLLKLREKEERERRRLEEKEGRMRAKQEKEEMKRREREEKEEAKRKEREEKEEVKRKEREEKEMRRKEREEKEEAKRKERELEKLKKLQEIEEKNREKIKMEEQKQKASAAFVNFFVAKKTEDNSCNKSTVKLEAFMPFEVKSDMKLAPLTRRQPMTDEEKRKLDAHLSNANDSLAFKNYLEELRCGGAGSKRTSGKTWPLISDDDEDVVVVDLGESVLDEKPKLEKIRAKFLKFHENQRPAYYGTWRKRSGTIRAKRPFALDKSHFDYEVDSDDDWEEEEKGESITNSDGEENKENNESDYEVDNEFFVPHGHLSDDEVDDEDTRPDPSAHKAKLKLLKSAFEEEMKNKTQKLKSRFVGCVWYKKSGDAVDDAVHKLVAPLAAITRDGRVVIRKRSEITERKLPKRSLKLPSEAIAAEFLKTVDGSVKKQKAIVDCFVEANRELTVGKSDLRRLLKRSATWTKCPVRNKLCWVVSDEAKRQYGGGCPT